MISKLNILNVHVVMSALWLTRRTGLLVCVLPLLQMLVPQPGEDRWQSNRTKIQDQLPIKLLQ